MNLYKSTGKKMEGWPQWVDRLIREKRKLVLRNEELEEENLDWKRRCSELYEDLCEERKKKHEV